MSQVKIYKNYCYLAGIKIPVINITISTQYGSIASLQVSLPYSPFIIHIYPFTKIQIFEQITENGINKQPTLEFDGVVTSVTKQLNALGQAGCSLTCYTDGIIWNKRKRYDFYLSEITRADARLTGDETVLRADGAIENFFGDVLQNNQFDIGCAICSILTQRAYGIIDQDPKVPGRITPLGKPEVTQYTYSYNGKQYKKPAPEGVGVNELNPSYYNKYLKEYKLANKVYGITTSQAIKSFFEQDRFIKLITNMNNDLHGENTFWSVALQIMEYGFYNVYDIPNPCYIPANNSKEDKEFFTLGADLEVEQKESVTTSLARFADRVTLNSGRTKAGLAEYIFKPISVLGIPFKCNVIWPDQKIAESITYDHFNSPSRVIMQRQSIPGDTGRDIVLTSDVFAGPVFSSKDGKYLSSYLPEQTTFTSDDIMRAGNIYSEYEKQYGVNYHRLTLSYAFNQALLQDGSVRHVEGADNTASDKAHATADKTRINKFLNYEFAQAYFGARQYNIQVTPDVNPVVGMPIVILDRTGQHVVAFCLGITKTWNATGQKTINLNVGYPRYYYEDIGVLGNIVDPTCSDENSLQELKTIIGSDSLLPYNSTTGQLKTKIEEIFKLFIQDQSDNKEEIKSHYSRSGICTYGDFLDLHGIPTTNNLDESFNLFKTTVSEQVLSTNDFTVYDDIENKVTRHYRESNKTILEAHKEWCSRAHRI